MRVFVLYVFGQCDINALLVTNKSISDRITKKCNAFEMEYLEKQF